MVPDRLNPVAQHYYRACVADVASIKPGNVSTQSDAHGMCAKDFLQSAQVTAEVINRDLPLAAGELGNSILKGAQATMTTVGTNTNLGILLLCFPLAHAAASCDTHQSIPSALKRVLTVANVRDTQMIFDAITAMQPAGLGRRNKHDANLPATADLLTVMRSSAEHDKIAWQYSHNFSDVFDFGIDSLFSKHPDVLDNLDSAQLDRALTKAASNVFMDFLSEYPDTHITRKHGATMAEAVRDEARKKRNLLNSIDQSEERKALLRNFDQTLKARGINPGTSADLTVAVLYAALLGTLPDVGNIGGVH